MEIEGNKRGQWIDVKKPAGKELAWLQETFNLHPIIVDELREPSARARVEQYDDYLYFIYYFPIYDTKDGASERTEIDFIVTKHSVATVHYEPLTGVFDDFDIGGIKSSLELTYRLIEHLINFQERQLRHVREKVETIGREIFHDKEKEILEKITYLKRDISEYRIVVRLQGPVLNSLAAKGKTFWGDDSEIYLNNLVGDHLKVFNQLEDYREAVRDFEDTNNQLMNLKINNVMKTFTSLSFLTLPFVVLASLLAMRTGGVPLVDNPNGFWIVVGLMVVVMGVLWLYFKNKKWF
jgi:magnesium transporter